MSHRNKGIMFFCIGMGILFMAVAYFYFDVYHAVPHIKLVAPLRYFQYSEGQESGSKVTLDADSVIYKSLQIWLNKKRTWQMDINTYVPQQVITGQGFDLNFTGNKIVLNVCEQEGNDWNQYSCNADEESAVIFRNIQENMRQ